MIVYVDMDNVMCDFNRAKKLAIKNTPDNAYPHSQVDFFRQLEEIDGAIDALIDLCEAGIDVYILTAPSTLNPMSYMEKMLWVRDHLGQWWVERLIISKHKHLNVGDYLVDDMAGGCGQEQFIGTLLQFGSKQYPNWITVKEFLIHKKQSEDV
jgi:5'(3')-deoxyribonucleotidase